MGWVTPLFGPDAGRLVWREAAALPHRPPPDEAALDAVIPGRAAIRESYRPSHDAADRARRGAEGAAEVLYEQAREAGDNITREWARDRVNTARARAAATRRERGT